LAKEDFSRFLPTIGGQPCDRLVSAGIFCARKHPNGPKSHPRI